MKMLEKKPAEKLFKQFCEGYNHRDLAGLLKLFTVDINMWGSGIDEYRVGLKQVEEQLQRDWLQSEKSDITVVSFVPTVADAPWAAAVCHATVTIDGQAHFFEHLRGTIVIAKENGTWKISHMHTSFPDVRNAENESFPVNG